MIKDVPSRVIRFPPGYEGSPNVPLVPSASSTSLWPDPERATSVESSAPVVTDNFSDFKSNMDEREHLIAQRLNSFARLLEVGNSAASNSVPNPPLDATPSVERALDYLAAKVSVVRSANLSNPSVEERLGRNPDFGTSSSSGNANNGFAGSPPTRSLLRNASHYSSASDLHDKEKIKQQLLHVSQTLQQVEAQRNAIVQDRIRLEDDIKSLQQQLDASESRRKEEAREWAERMEAATLETQKNMRESRRQIADLEKKCADQEQTCADLESKRCALDVELTQFKENGQGSMAHLRETLKHYEASNNQLHRDKYAISGQCAEASARCERAMRQQDELRASLNARISQLQEEIGMISAREKEAQARADAEERTSLEWENKYFELESLVMEAVGLDKPSSAFFLEDIKSRLLDLQFAERHAASTQKYQDELERERARFDAVSRNLARLANRVSNGSCSMDLTPDEAIRAIGRAWAETLSSGLRPRRSYPSARNDSSTISNDHSTASRDTSSETSQNPLLVADKAIDSTPHPAQRYQDQTSLSHSQRTAASKADQSAIDGLITMEAPQSTLVDDTPRHFPRLSDQRADIANSMPPPAIPPVLNQQRASTAPSERSSPSHKDLSSTLKRSPASPAKQAIPPSLLLRDSDPAQLGGGKPYWLSSHLDPRERYQVETATTASSPQPSSVSSSDGGLTLAALAAWPVQGNVLVASPAKSTPTMKKNPSVADSIFFHTAETPALNTVTHSLIAPSRHVVVKAPGQDAPLPKPAPSETVASYPPPPMAQVAAHTAPRSQIIPAARMHAPPARVEAPEAPLSRFEPHRSQNPRSSDPFRHAPSHAEMVAAPEGRARAQLGSVETLQGPSNTLPQYGVTASPHRSVDNAAPSTEESSSSTQYAVAAPPDDSADQTVTSMNTNGPSSLASKAKAMVPDTAAIGGPLSPIPEEKEIAL